MFWIYILIVIGLLSGSYLFYRALKSDTDEEAVSFCFLSGGNSWFFHSRNNRNNIKLIMITEDYVSFEVAKLLKEKGFDVECCSYYREANKNIKPSMSTGPANWNNNNFLLSCPTLQMAVKWLREKHNLHIITLPYAPFDRHSYHPGFEADKVYIAQLFRGIIPIDEIGRKVIKLTHEEACEAAIKYCFENLI